EIKPGSDSEVLLHLIEDYYQGELKQAVKKVMPFLDGMYAFAVTDGHALVLARDPIGKKPVYYTPTFPFAFVSEPKALNGQARKLKRLKPGEILEVKDGKIRTTLGYRIERPQIQIDDSEEAIAAYATAIDRSIAKRTHGLDRGAVLFSGGVDSVFVAQLLKHAGLSVTGYCSGLEEATDVQHAMQAAQEMDIPLRIAFLTEDLVDGVLADVIAAIELNGMVQVEAAIPMYLAAKMASEDGHKIMFTGQAADELFAGYPWYGTVVRDEGYLALHHKMWHDIDQLYLDTLEREDRMTMVHSLELRAPYLDREVIRTAMQISPRQKIKGPEDPYRKLVHRELALRRSVPEFIAYRKKARAQDGTKVQSLLQILAEKYFKGRTIPTELELTDYGSNYRYLKEEYGTQELAAYLAEISKPHNIIVPSV
ncbi:MAG: asparagine synthetase B family protein, partial [Candidatus Methylomirabilales bacterium]